MNAPERKGLPLFFVSIKITPVTLWSSDPALGSNTGSGSHLSVYMDVVGVLVQCE